MKPPNHFAIDKLYLAGEQVPAGRYRDVDTRREVRLEQEGRLPASLDGRIAAYACVEYTWTQHQARQDERTA